jgi:hypothetical protein
VIQLAVLVEGDTVSKTKITNVVVDGNGNGLVDVPRSARTV